MVAFLTDSCCNLPRSDRMEQLESRLISESLKPDTTSVRPAWFYLPCKWIAEKNVSSKICRLSAGAALLQKLLTFFAFSESRGFITVFIRLRPLAHILCQINPVHSVPSCLRYTFILAFLLCLGLQNYVFPSGFLIEILSSCCSPPPCACHMLHSLSSIRSP